MRNYLYFFFSFAVLATACHKKVTSKNNQPTEQHIEQTVSPVGTWSIVKFPSENEKKTKSYQIVFNKDNTVGLTLDVNSCGSNYEAKDGYLVFTEGMSCTEICCDSKEAMALSSLFRGSLKYNIVNKNMTIETENGSIRLIKNNNPLQGTSWIATSYTNEDSKKATKFSKEYMLTFDATRIQLRLDANSCNTSISYIEQKSMFELPTQGMGCTRKCCDSKDGILLMNMLQGKISYQKENHQLTLTTSKETIVFAPYKGSSKTD